LGIPEEKRPNIARERWQPSDDKQGLKVFKAERYSSADPRNRDKILRMEKEEVLTWSGAEWEGEKNNGGMVDGGGKATGGNTTWNYFWWWAHWKQQKNSD
jgi:hypothetical protein